MSRLVFLFKDLDALTQKDVRARQRITNVVSTAVLDECNFDTLRDVNFDVVASRHWKDYVDLIKTDSQYRSFLLYKYFQAFRHLHDENPEYFEQIQYDVSKARFDVRETGYTKEEQFLRFTTLASGFFFHLGNLDKGGREWKEAVSQFYEALRNRRLIQQLFGDADPLVVPGTPYQTPKN